MEYTWIQIGWLFFIYSLVGWIAEVCLAAIRKKKFINRGFVNAPLCPIYGLASVLFTLFLPELRGNLFFLFLGGGILATALEFSTGLLMHKIFRQKLWDYSDKKWNLDGYICFGYSLLWGALAVLSMLLVNPALCWLLHFIPTPVSRIVLLVLTILLILDFIRVSLAVLSPQSTSGQVFAAGCGYYKLACLFFIGAFLGDITETIFCLITSGKLMSRSSVIYGPFSIVWGLGCALLTALLYRYRNKDTGFIFLAGALLGGAYEYICSVFTEIMFGTVFWDYSGFQFNLGGRINLLYCFFWGIAAIVWLKGIYPKLCTFIERIPIKPGKLLCNLMTVFMIINMAISALALARYAERNTPEDPVQIQDTMPSQDWLNNFLDKHYDDERMARIYPNAKIVVDGRPMYIAP